MLKYIQKNKYNNVKKIYTNNIKIYTKKINTNNVTNI